MAKLLAAAAVTRARSRR